MTDRQRSVIFILISTVVTILIMLVLVVVLAVIALMLFKENTAAILPLIFLLAMMSGSLISQKLMNVAVKKLNLEDKLGPLFGNKNRRNRMD